jgi:hypothetical protein
VGNAIQSNKCSVLHLGNNNTRYIYNCMLQGKQMELAQSLSEKDLGITIDARLDFGDHINN